jgi:hypothetical protein
MSVCCSSLVVVLISLIVTLFCLRFIRLLCLNSGTAFTTIRWESLYRTVARTGELVWHHYGMSVFYSSFFFVVLWYRFCYFIFHCFMIIEFSPQWIFPMMIGKFPRLVDDGDVVTCWIFGSTSSRRWWCGVVTRPTHCFTTMLLSWLEPARCNAYVMAV